MLYKVITGEPNSKSSKRVGLFESLDEAMKLAEWYVADYDMRQAKNYRVEVREDRTGRLLYRDRLITANW